MRRRGTKHEHESLRFEWLPQQRVTLRKRKLDASGALKRVTASWRAAATVRPSMHSMAAAPKRPSTYSLRMASACAARFRV